MHKLAKTKISISSNLNPINSYKIQSHKITNKKDSIKKIHNQELTKTLILHTITKKITRHNILSNQFFLNTNSITNTNELQTKKSVMFIDGRFTTFSITEL